MVPDVALRLRTVAKALEDVIGPAIPDDAPLAREQLALSQRSIALALDQLPLETAYMVRDSRDDRRLARRLINKLDGNHPLASQLIEAVATNEATMPVEPRSSDEVRDAWRSLKEVLEYCVSRLSGSESFVDQAELAAIMLEYSESRNIRERAWVAATGFDPDPDSLPDLETAALSDLQ